MEQFIQFAGLRFRVHCPEPFLSDPGILEQYLAQPGPWDHDLSMELVTALPEPEGELAFSCPEFRFYQRDDLWERRVHDYLCIRRRGPETKAVFRRESLPFGITAKRVLTALELEQQLADHNGFLLHASYIRHGDRAILFTAPSETGKSTQARLWCENRGAELINGDRAAVRLIDGVACACGIPYSGSSPVRKNVVLPLAAIVYLSQGRENTIERLRGAKAFRRIWEGCGVPLWDRSALDRVTRTVTETLMQVPVYHLSCTPDVRAVDLLAETMEETI